MFLGRDQEGQNGQSAKQVTQDISEHEAQENCNDDAQAPVRRTWNSGVEIAIVGHLPMPAHVWTSQAVRVQAGLSAKRCALIRLDQASATVQLFDPAPDADTWISPTHSYHDAICAICHCERILLVLDGGEFDKLLASGKVPGQLCAFHLLTGADDASAVAAYRMMKRVAADAQNGDGREAGAISICVSICGSGEAKALGAWNRLAESARSFLGAELELAGICGQIDTTPAMNLVFDGAVCGDELGELGLVEKTLEMLEKERFRGRMEYVGKGVDFSSVIGQSEQSMHKVSVGHSVATQVASGISVDGNANVSFVQGSSVHDVRVPIEHGLDGPEAVIARDDGRNAFNGHTPGPHTPSPARRSLLGGTDAAQNAQGSGLMIAGLTALNIRCPHEPSVIVCVDRSGVPQVVASAVASAMADCVHRLLVVSSWMWTNRELIAQVMTLNNAHANLRTDLRATMHVITDKPAEARRLLDSDVKIHMLADVSKASNGLVCVPLN
jgi:hypothetical protein